VMNAPTLELLETVRLTLEAARRMPQRDSENQI